MAVYASAWLDKPKHSGKTKRGRNVADIDIGLYLDSRWASEHVLVTPGLRLSTGERVRGPRAILYPWEDWGVPEDLTLFKLVLQWLMEEIRVGKTVEVGCMGGHGRTGTVLGCLLILQGRPWEEVIDMVRDGYCEDAIESRSQLRLLRSLA